MQINLATPDTSAMIADANNALALPENYAITTVDEYVSAADKLKIVKGFAAKWEEQRKELKAPILDAGKKIDDMFRAPRERLDAIERTLKGAVVRYTEEQDRIRREEQRKAEEAARKERERIEAEARKAAQEAERKAAELAAQAEAARVAGNIEAADKLEAKAETTINKAADKIDTLHQRAAAVPMRAVQTQAPPKVDGLKLRQRWYAEVIDASLVPREYLIVDESSLGKVAEATKGAIKIPGVRIYSRTEAASARR